MEPITSKIKTIKKAHTNAYWIYIVECENNEHYKIAISIAKTLWMPATEGQIRDSLQDCLRNGDTEVVTITKLEKENRNELM